MKKFLLALFVFCFTATLFAAPKGWMSDLNEVLRLAKAEKKPVLILITGSDWCPPCKRLYRDVLDTKDFQKFAEKKLLLLYVDSPRRPSPADRALLRQVQSKYGRARGVPHTIILNSYGEVIDQFSGYRRDYLKQIKKIIRKNR